MYFYFITLFPKSFLLLTFLFLGTMPFYPKSSFFNRYDSNVLAARRVHCLELLEFAAKHQQLYNSQVFLNFFATVSSPTSLNSDEEIGQLMDKGQIMVGYLDT